VGGGGGGGGSKVRMAYDSNKTSRQIHRDHKQRRVKRDLSSPRRLSRGHEMSEGEKIQRKKKNTGSFEGTREGEPRRMNLNNADSVPDLVDNEMTVKEAMTANTLARVKRRSEAPKSHRVFAGKHRLRKEFGGT